MSKFKVGDKVRVLAFGGTSEYNGKVGKIVGAQSLPEYPYNRVTGIEYATMFLDEELELVTEVRALKGDNKLVFKALSDGVSWSVSELEEFIKTHSNRQPTAATITARIRDLRKPIYGGFRIDRTQQGKNHFYKLVQGA